jgi:hypothetical protein
MRLYRLDENLQIVDLGPFSRSAAIALLDDCLAAWVTPGQSGVKAVARTAFGISRNDDDFVELTVHDLHHIDLHTDRLAGSVFQRLFAKAIVLRLADRDAAIRVVDDYSTLSRIDFGSACSSGRYA